MILDNEMWGKELDGLRLGCVADNATFRRGKLVELIILIKNTRGEETVLREERSFLSYEFEVVDSDHRTVPLTKSGELRKSPDARFVRRPRRVRIAAGEVYTQTFPIEDFVDLSKPDEYEVRLTRKTDGGSLHAPPLRLRII